MKIMYADENMIPSLNFSYELICADEANFLAIETNVNQERLGV